MTEVRLSSSPAGSTGSATEVRLSLFGGVLFGSEAARLRASPLFTDSPYTSGEDDDETASARSSRKRKLPVSGSAASGTTGSDGGGDGRCVEHTAFVSACSLPTNKGTFTLRAYRHTGRKFHEPVVMVAGEASGEGVLIRVHDQCATSEVLGSMRCDCREQLQRSLEMVQQHGGAVIYLQQEGRGIGLANKVAAYALQDGGLDTVDANLRLGFADDERSYECVPAILADMRVASVRLMTNNPMKVEALRALGVNVLGTVPVIAPAHEHNARYLRAKVARMGHLIDGL